MITKKKTNPGDLIEILKIFYRSGIRFSDKQIPLLLLKILYKFLWDLIYQAKLFSKHKKKRRIGFEDINIASKLVFFRILDQKKHSKKFQKIKSIFNSEPLPKKNQEESPNLNRPFQHQFYKENLRLKTRKKKSGKSLKIV